MKTNKGEPIISFKSPQELRAWLSKNHGKSNGIWLKIFKKASAIPSVTYDEALDEALCFGWIDGQKNKFDDKSWLQRFTPRRPKSIWSKRNREHITRLTKEKRMMPAGIQAVEEAKKDGRWSQAYGSSKDMEVPPDFLNELKKDTKAYAFFRTLNRANTHAIAYRLQTAKKPETRERRKKSLIMMMQQRKKLH